MAFEQEHLISHNITRFLQDNLKEGEEAEIAIHPELRHVLVFVNGALVLTCGFDELIAGPGGSNN